MTPPATETDAPVYSDWPWAASDATSAIGRARAAALQALAGFESEPTSLVEYSSSGAVLVIGPADAAWSAARALPEGMRCVVLATSGDTPSDAVGCEQPVLVRGALAGLRGHLGAFTAELAGDGERVIDLGALYLSPSPTFDLVLDLGSTPAFAQLRPPLGYFRPGRDPGALDAAILEIPTLVGEFQKPRFFDYDPSICAHGRSGQRGCTRCLDACSTGAITSLGERIAVDPFLCQGDGGCTTVCPSGAIRYAYPAPRDLLRGLRAMLAAWATTGATPPRVLLHDAEGGHDWLRDRAGSLPDDVLPLQVEEITAAGLEVWLAAVAYGARGVGLLLGTLRATHETDTLGPQVEIANAMLSGLGHGHDTVALVAPGALEQWCAAPAGAVTDAPPARFETHNAKRETLRLATTHLFQVAAAPAVDVSLPRHAPFGAVAVDRDACTLCMACVSVCPSHALADGGDTPRLDFTEDLCLQCGLCQRACPESAISLQPRFLFDPAQRCQPRMLNEEEPFGCVECGTPFATHSVMQRMAERLAAHPLWADEGQQRRMRMCGDCRVKDMMRADIAKFRDQGAA